MMLSSLRSWYFSVDQRDSPVVMSRQAVMSFPILRSKTNNTFASHIGICSSILRSPFAISLNGFVQTTLPSLLSTKENSLSLLPKQYPLELERPVFSILWSSFVVQVSVISCCAFADWQKY